LVVPSTPNGKIMYVDFAALEARVLLYRLVVSVQT
jgi:hypothetical protein